jgi:hypothetical protein
MFDALFSGGAGGSVLWLQSLSGFFEVVAPVVC